MLHPPLGGGEPPPLARVHDALHCRPVPEPHHRQIQARRRALLSAYSCGPGLGSEPGIGWHTARCIAAHHDGWVLTSREVQPRIEAALAAWPGPVRFVFVDWPPWLPWTTRTRIGFEAQQYLWQIDAYEIARRMYRLVRFDVAHYVTICRYWLLSWKGFHLGLQAFARCGDDEAEYWIAGEGPARPGLERLARALGIERRVRFLGALARARALSVQVTAARVPRVSGPPARRVSDP